MNSWCTIKMRCLIADKFSSISSLGLSFFLQFSFVVLCIHAITPLFIHHMQDLTNPGCYKGSLHHLVHFHQSAISWSFHNTFNWKDNVVGITSTRYEQATAGRPATDQATRGIRRYLWQQTSWLIYKEACSEMLDTIDLSSWQHETCHAFIMNSPNQLGPPQHSGVTSTRFQEQKLIRLGIGHLVSDSLAKDTRAETHSHSLTGWPYTSDF